MREDIAEPHADLAVDRETSPGELRKVVFTASLGAMLQWYDFYIYAVLAPVFAPLFFPPEHATAGVVSALGAYAAGFLLRPLGAVIFGRMGDRIGRKPVLLLSLFLMGLTTLIVGLMPGFDSSPFFGTELPGIGWTAPAVLLGLRLLQGLALGGAYCGAAIYVAEHAGPRRRGLATAWVQTTATLGFLLSLIVTLTCRSAIDPADFASWGWRIPFLLSFLLLGVSLYIRLGLEESPAFLSMKAGGRGSKAPLRYSFCRSPNGKFVLLALFGATAGQAVVWFTGQFFALFFLLGPLRVDFVTACLVIAAALIIGTPFFILFGWLSDRIGRKWLVMTGCLLAIMSYFPLFKMLTETANPALAAYHAKHSVTVKANPATCGFHVFAGPWSRQSDCDRARNHLAMLGIGYSNVNAAPGEAETVTIGQISIPIAGFQEGGIGDRITAAALTDGWPAKATLTHGGPGVSLQQVCEKAIADPAFWKAAGIIAVMVIYAAMVYAPLAAWLADLFPPPVRYTSMSLPYHIGNAWIGGMLPLLAPSMMAAAGSIYAALWYPVAVAMMTLVIGAAFLPQRR